MLTFGLSPFSTSLLLWAPSGVTSHVNTRGSVERYTQKKYFQDKITNFYSRGQVVKSAIPNTQLKHTSK